MSNRTLVEINHDHTPHNEEALLEWSKNFERYLGSGEPKYLPHGVTYLGIRHHSDHGKMTPPCGWDNRAKKNDQRVRRRAAWLCYTARIRR